MYMELIHGPSADIDYLLLNLADGEGDKRIEQAKGSCSITGGGFAKNGWL